MLQLQQQQENRRIDNNDPNEKTDAPKPNNGIILEGDNADTILNPNSISRIINDVNSDSEDSDCKF